MMHISIENRWSNYTSNYVQKVEAIFKNGCHKKSRQDNFVSLNILMFYAFPAVMYKLFCIVTSI